jgi:hypothetical protein
VIPRSAKVLIISRDFWFKIVDFLQQSWALIDEGADAVTVWFLDDGGGVSTGFHFPRNWRQSVPFAATAFAASRLIGGLKHFIATPRTPFHNRPNPNGPIYSSGRYWK